MPAQGLWNIGGFNLPDFGLSEKLGIGPKNAAVNPSYGKLETNTQVAGVNTYKPPTTNTTGSNYPNSLNGYGTYGTSGGGSAPVAQPQQVIDNGGGQPQVDPYAQIKAEIGSAWDNYLNSLGGLESGLLGQRTAQEGIAKTQYDSGINQINDQKASSLRDISSNITNAFKAGNNYLGSRGAGDSSAANQYQFALSKEASKQTGQLNEFVNSQTNTLKANYDTQINQIAQWFNDAQNQVKQMVAQGQLQKSQDINNLSRSILDQAMQARAQLQQNAQNRYNALLEWAAGNSTNISQLQQNIAAIPQAIGAPQIDSSGNIFAAPTGFGNTNDQTQVPLFQQGYSWF